MDTGEGLAHAVVAEDSGLVVAHGIGLTRAEAVDDAIAALGPKEPLSFHRSLSEEAARRRLPVSEPTTEQLEMRAVLSVAMSHGPLLPPPSLEGVMEALLFAATRFAVTEPWRLWSSDNPLDLKFRALGKEWRAASILGYGGEAFGLVLHRAGGFERALSGKKPRDFLALHIEREMDDVEDAVDELTGVRFAPLIQKMTNGRPARIKGEDLLVLATAAGAVCHLCEQNALAARVELASGGKAAVLDLKAPPPDAGEDEDPYRIVSRRPATHTRCDG